MKKFNQYIYNLLKPFLNLPKEVYVIFISRIINATGAFVGVVMNFILQGPIGLSTEDAGLFLMIAGGILIFPPLIGGKLADTIGKKKTIIIFDLIGVTFYFICALIPTGKILIIFLFGASLFYSIGGPAHDALLGDLSTPENRKQVFTLSYMGWNIGYIFGGLLAGFLYANHLWLIFVGDAGTTLISLILIILFIKNKYPKKEPNQIDHLEQDVYKSTLEVIFKRPKLIFFALIIMGLNFVYSQWGFLLQSNLKQLYLEDLGALYYGRLAAINGAVVIFFTAILSGLFLKVKNFKLIFLGGLLYAIGLGSLGFYDFLFPSISIRHYINFFYLGVFIFTFGEILLTISVNPYIYNHTPANHRGRMSATLGLLMGMGYLIGPITGMLVKPLGYATIWKLIGLIALVSALFMLLLGKLDQPNVSEINLQEKA